MHPCIVLLQGTHVPLWRKNPVSHKVHDWVPRQIRQPTMLAQRRHEPLARKKPCSQFRQIEAEAQKRQPGIRDWQPMQFPPRSRLPLSQEVQRVAEEQI